MKQEHAKRIRLIYGIVLSLVTVIAGICLMVACYGIYTSGGEQTYTPQKVAEAFAPIAVPVWLCLALVIGGFILDFALPVQKQKRKAEKNHAFLLQRLREKADISQADPQLQRAIEAQQKGRRLHALISALLLTVGSIIFLAYALNGKHFDQVDITGSVIRAMWLLIPCMAVPFGYAVFSAYYTRASLQKEIELVQQVGTSGSRPEAPAKDTRKLETLLRCALVCVAVVLMVYGFVAGGWADVLTKAVNICTECVGLG